MPTFVRNAVLVWQDFKCLGCKTDITRAPIEFDHILPLELGGSTKLENIQALCIPCHKIKTADDIKRIRKAQRLERDADPTTRRKSPHRLRSRPFGGKDPLKERP